MHRLGRGWERGRLAATRETAQASRRCNSALDWRDAPTVLTPRVASQVHEIENKAQRISPAGSEPEVVGAFERVVEDWCRGTEQLLQEMVLRLGRACSAADTQVVLLAFNLLIPLGLQVRSRVA